MYHDLKDCHLPLSFKPAPSLSGIFTQATAFAGELRGIQQQQDEAEVGRHHQRDRRHQDLHQKVNLVILSVIQTIKDLLLLFDVLHFNHVFMSHSDFEIMSQCYFFREKGRERERRERMLLF